MDQTKLFQQSEGDAWFKRNAQHLGKDVEADAPLSLIKSNGIKPKRVLEIGAANGYRLAWIRRMWRCECWGIDPSKEAVRDGSSRFPQIHLSVGVGHQLPYIGGSRGGFDLIIVNFVFHWVDRKYLLGTVAEIDRVLSDEGFLVIGDFYPDYPSKTRYHHLPEQEVWTWKQNYAAPFLASGLYRLVAMTTGTQGLPTHMDADESDARMANFLLQKIPGGGYLERQFGATGSR